MIFAFFDFDGTISRADSFTDFIRFAVGKRTFLTGLVELSPALVAFLSRRISNSELKEKFLVHYFAGWPEQLFRTKASEYSQTRLPRIVKASAVERIQWHKRQRHTVAVVSASVDYWLKDWCDSRELELVSTRVEIKDGTLTGRIAGKNCYGIEKVERIRRVFPLDGADYIYAYGDSKGDREMLELADEKYFKFFK